MNSLDSMKLFDLLPDENVFSEALKTNCLNLNNDDDKYLGLDDDVMDKS